MVLEVNAEPAAVKELERQLGLSESVIRTKLLRKVEPRKTARQAKARATA